MTATVSTDFANHLKGRAHQRCWLLRLDLRDGATIIGVTDHDQLISFDLSDGKGSVDFRPDLGLTLSDVKTGTGLDAGNFEATFPITDAGPFTRDAVLGGKFNRAETRLMQVIWSNLAAGPRKFMFGNSGEWRVEGAKAICEVRDQRDRLNQTVGEQIQNQCSADYADQVECFATPTEITGTVSAVSSAKSFTVTFTGSYADGFFNRGELTGLTGANAGLSFPIWSWTAAGVIETYWPLVEAPPIGDTFTVRDGCDRTMRGPNGCVVHNQVRNFRGFPDVPGQKALRPAPPQAASGGGKGGK